MAQQVAYGQSGEYTVSAGSSDDDLEQRVRGLCIEHGAVKVWRSLIGVMDAARIPIPQIKKALEKQAAEPRADRPAKAAATSNSAEPSMTLNKHGEPVAENRRAGGLQAWQTRLQKDALMKRGMTKEQATSYLREERNKERSRVDPPKTQAWASRIERTIRDAAAEGETIDELEARRRCTEPLRKGRKVAAS